MNFVNIHTSTLKTAAYVAATREQQAVWLNLVGYCCTQENGGKIPASADWNDMQWLLTAGVRLEEIRQASKLWHFDGADLVVEFYPLEQESNHIASRKGGQIGNQRRWKNRKNTPPTSPPDSPPDSGKASPPESVKECKGKERKEKEESETDSLSPAAVTGGTLDAETDDAGQGAIGEFAEWPTREEWLAACDMEALPRELALREWNNQESKTPAQRWRKGSGPIDRSRLRHHAAYVKDFARQRGELGLAEKKFRPPTTTGNAGAATMAAMEAMGADLTRASEYPAALKEAVKS